MRPAECQPVVAEFYFAESPIEELCELVLDNCVNDNTSARDLDRTTIPEALKQHFRDCLESLGYAADPVKWRYWTGMVHPGHVSSREGWAKGFPHNHQWDGLTCVHYVQLPDSGGDTVVFEDDKVTERGRISPELGKTSVLDGWSEHGVEEVFGETDRMTIIATGYR
jgi:hypothetical protein